MTSSALVAAVVMVVTETNADPELFRSAEKSYAVKPYNLNI